MWNRYKLSKRFPLNKYVKRNILFFVSFFLKIAPLSLFLYFSPLLSFAFFLNPSELVSQLPCDIRDSHLGNGAQLPLGIAFFHFRWEMHLFSIYLNIISIERNQLGRAKTQFVAINYILFRRLCVSACLENLSEFRLSGKAKKFNVRGSQIQFSRHRNQSLLHSNE